MHRKAIVIIVLVIAFVSIAAFAMTRMAQRVAAPTQESSSTAQTAASSAATSSMSAASSTSVDGEFVWVMQEAEMNPVTEGPQTRVLLAYEGQRHEAGVFQGSCYVLEGDRLDANEKSGVMCWYAGGGDEIGVFEENGRLVLKKGVIEEGTDVSPGFRGDFKAIVTL